MNNCIEWPGGRTPRGYGSRWNPDTQKTDYAHRMEWARHHGPIPKGMCIMHTCDNPPCVNIEHLRLGTQADNLADMMAKGRHGRTRLRSSDVEDIRRALAVGISVKQLAVAYEVHPTTIYLRIR